MPRKAAAGLRTPEETTTGALRGTRVASVLANSAWNHEGSTTTKCHQRHRLTPNEHLGDGHRAAEGFLGTSSC